MILRIVHMRFRPGTTDEFLALFEQHRKEIAAQPGCRRLELVMGLEDPCKMSTVSLWEAKEDLEAYRNGPLFGVVWPATKALFSQPPEAESHTMVWAS